MAVVEYFVEYFEPWQQAPEAVASVGGGNVFTEAKLEVSVQIGEGKCEVAASKCAGVKIIKLICFHIKNYLRKQKKIWYHS